MVDFDVIGSKPALRVLNLAHNPLAAGISKDLAIMPFIPPWSQ